jgi:hypothetical protein
MVERLIRSAANFVVLVAFTLLLPLFCLAAGRWGSADEVWLMKVLGCVLSPFCTVMWYIVASHLLLRRRSSYFLQLVVFCVTAYGTWWLISTGKLTF